jgi:hypothetical protein
LEVTDQMSYGAMIALASDEGNSTGACLEESVPMHSVFGGTALSQLSSWDDSSLLFAEYHDPACVASRLTMSTDLAFNFLKNCASAYSNKARNRMLVELMERGEAGDGSLWWLTSNRSRHVALLNIHASRPAFQFLRAQSFFCTGSSPIQLSLYYQLCTSNFHNGRKAQEVIRFLSSVDSQYRYVLMSRVVDKSNTNAAATP